MYEVELKLRKCHNLDEKRSFYKEVGAILCYLQAFRLLAP